VNRTFKEPPDFTLCLPFGCQFFKSGNCFAAEATNAQAGSPTPPRRRPIPFLGAWTARHLDELVAEVVDGAQEALQSAVGSAEHRRLVENLAEKAARLMIAELDRLESEETVKALIVDMLEEQKKKLLA
jgi:hypothetical protein